MRITIKNAARVAIGALLGLSLVAHAGVTNAPITLLAGTGFDDPTPVAPVGGNPGTTLGQQRTNLFNYAAARWSERLRSSVPVVVSAQFSDFDDTMCTDSLGTLGGARSGGFLSNFVGAPLSDVFYPIALANAITGSDGNGASPEIIADFNADVDTRATCLGGVGFYYGFDHNRGTRIDLLNTVMHELGHGLGFASIIDPATGISAGGSSVSIFDTLLFDETTTLPWSQLSNTQRQASAVNTGSLTWRGNNVIGSAVVLTAGRHPSGRVRMYAPSPVQPGSSVSHWDNAVSPELLMQPFLGDTLTADQKVDFTSCLLRDIGWTINAGFGCPDNLVDLAVTETASTDTVASGSTLTYTITARNNGRDPAHDVTINNAFAGPGRTVQTVTSSQGSCTALPCNLGVVAVGAEANVTLTVRVNASGTLNSIASGGSGETETNAADNSASIAVVAAANPSNQTPIAVADAFTVAANSAATVLDVLANDSDPDVGQTVSVTAIGPASPAESAILAIAGSGSGILFTPSTGFSGTTTFAYTISDGNGGTANGEVTVTVTPPTGTVGGTTGGGTGGFTRGGGGAMGFASLVALLGFAGLRRRRITVRN